MQNFVRKPSIDLYPGICVNKDTKLEYKNENVEQELENLVLHTVMKVSGKGYKSTCDTTICLSDGDILIFESEGRGYVKPVESFASVDDAIDDLSNIKDLG